MTDKYPRIIAHETFSGLIAKTTELETRIRPFDRYAYIHLMCSARGWRVICTNFPKITTEPQSDPFTALSLCELAIDRMVNADGALARTLGIAT